MNPHFESAMKNVASSMYTKDDPYFDKNHPYHKLTKHLAEAYGTDAHYKRIAKERRIKIIKYTATGLLIFIAGFVLGVYL
jgi:hypothetical protein